MSGLRRERYCEAPTGNQSWCGEPATGKLDGEWLCDWHATRFEALLGLVAAEVQ